MTASERTGTETIRALRPGWAVLPLLLLFHFVLWWLAPTLLAWTVQADNAEQLVLSQELAWSYPKHPPLPTWLLYLFVEAFGPSFGLTYFLGAACAAVTLVIIYRIANEFVSPERSVLVTMLSMLIVYHGYLATSFNHNTVQLPLAAATISLLHFALKHRRWTWWAALGAVAALNVLTKYSAVLLLSCLGAYLIIAGHLHQREIRRGLAVAAMVFALALAPHVSEVLRSDGRSFAYAAEMVSIGSLGPGGRLETIWNFFWAQVARLAPALIAFAIVLRSARRQGAILPRAPALTVEQQWFLWLVGWGPLALTLLFPIVSGARLFTGWGTTFFVLFALWLVTRERLSFNPTPTLLRRTLIIVVALEILLAAVVAWGGGKFPNPLKRLPVAQLPPSDLALHTRAMWSRHSDAPPCVIATDVVTGAMLVTRMRGQVPILDHNHSLRHWMREHGCEAKAAVMLLDRPPNEAGLQTLPVAVRDDIRTADTIETFQVQGRGQIVTYYVAILSPQLSKAAREIQ